jgi:hypothetical protein
MPQAETVSEAIARVGVLRSQIRAANTHRGRVTYEGESRLAVLDAATRAITGTESLASEAAESAIAALRRVIREVPMGAGHIRECRDAIAALGGTV